MRTNAKLKTTWCGNSADLNDFGLRWRKARFSALNSILGETRELSDSEEMLVREVASRGPTLREALLKAVFHVGGFLASGMSRFYKRQWTLHEVSQLLGSAGHPCFSGLWKEHAKESGLGLTRPCCSSGDEPFICQYWKEAADGFITGLSDEIFFSCHSSAASASATCSHWIYSSRNSSLKFGPIPESCVPVVCDAIEHYRQNRVELEVLGCCEQTIYYRMKMTDGQSLCGLGKKLWDEDFHRRILSVMPHVKFLEVSPRGVLAEGP